MNLPPLPLINGALLVDNSMLEQFTTCPRALEYNKLHKRVSTAESPSLNFGSAIHLAMELRYKTCGHLPVDPLFMDAVTPLLEEFFTTHPTPIEDYRNFNWALEVIRRYNNKYQTEEFHLMEYHEPIECSHCDGKGSRVLLSNETQGADETTRVVPCHFCNETGKSKMMVELPFTTDLLWWEGILPIDSLPKDFPNNQILSPIVGGKASVKIRVLYCGRIDLPHLIGDDIFIMDHKTTSLLGPSFFETMKMSAQQKGYCWSFQQLTGRPVRGYQVNAIRIKEPPKYVTEGKTSRSGKAGTVDGWWDESLTREKYYLNEGELDEWHSNCKALVNEFFQNYVNDYFPRKTAWCVGKYGKCSYYDVCSLFPVSQRGMLLHSGNYQENKWTPLLSPSQSKQQGTA